MGWDASNVHEGGGDFQAYISIVKQDKWWSRTYQLQNDIEFNNFPYPALLSSLQVTYSVCNYAYCKIVIELVK